MAGVGPHHPRTVGLRQARAAHSRDSKAGHPNGWRGRERRRRAGPADRPEGGRRDRWTSAYRGLQGLARARAGDAESLGSAR
ncbi:hypothetical protein PAI11_17470 [Patulibacter medicamentivorans]|uniref:Uncharacterized protein n=1 Tax=Patulibacter medicamentivorans TaxID=1097667 RepID=H0E4L6_9ACTN|nr:hypothetical protein PAI11_17470 [Patulibacter medicamentivorans]